MKRPPSAVLRPFVALLWSQPPGAMRPGPTPGEHVLPTGMMHLAIRLGGPPLRLLDPDGAVREPGPAVVAGARDRHYAKQAVAGAPSVGAVLRPGAARALFGPSAGELAGRHVALDDLLGAHAARLHERLLEEPDPRRQLELLEAFLAARLPRARGLHPAVAGALAGFAAGADIGRVVARSGYSHRHLGALFVDAVGLTPQRFRRVRRFQLALDLHWRDPSLAWARVAHEAGYADQAHFVREFRGFTGVRPQDYRRAAPVDRNHLPLHHGWGKQRSIPFKTCAPAAVTFGDTSTPEPPQ